MPVLLRVDESTFPVHQAVIQTGVYPVPFEICKREVRGERISALPSAPPHTMFYTAVLAAAKWFTRTLEAKGLALHTPEMNMEVWGPYRHTEYMSNGKHFKAIGRPQDPMTEIERHGFVDIKIRGRFVAKYGKVPQRRCLSCKNEVHPTTVDCPWCGAPINRDLRLAAELAAARFDPFAR